jgi:hypothetical protein
MARPKKTAVSPRKKTKGRINGKPEEAFVLQKQKRVIRKR